MSESICTISLEKPDAEFDEDETEALEADFIFFLEPYLIKFLIRPGLSKSNKKIFQTTFVHQPTMQNTIEAFLDKTMSFEKYYRVKYSFDPLINKD